jgi:hypothetical protein
MDRKTITINEAYDAGFLFLEHLYHQNKTIDDLASILGGMARTSSGVPMEQAYWTDWMHSYWEIVVAPTDQEKALFTLLLSDPTNCLGEIGREAWYASLLPDGRQIWANVYNKRFQYGGIRAKPRSYHPQKGLSSIDNP